MSLSFILLGSNLGNSAELLNQAIGHIQQEAGEVVKRSSVYKTSPWSGSGGNDYLNQVIAVETILEPQVLMNTLLAIEERMGRKRVQKWEPRKIDLDILFYDELILRGELNIPHPLLHERRFTLIPLNEIAPGLIHPVWKKSVAELLTDCQDQGEVVPNSTGSV